MSAEEDRDGRIRRPFREAPEEIVVDRFVVQHVALEAILARWVQTQVGFDHSSVQDQCIAQQRHPFEETLDAHLLHQESERRVGAVRRRRSGQPAFFAEHAHAAGGFALEVLPGHRPHAARDHHLRGAVAEQGEEGAVALRGLGDGRCRLGELRLEAGSERQDGQVRRRVEVELGGGGARQDDRDQARVVAQPPWEDVISRDRRDPFDRVARSPGGDVG